MSLIPLTLCLVSLFAAIALGGDTVQLDSLVQQCRFMVDGITFDLCPLFGTQEQKVWATQWTRETPPTVTSSWYKFSIDGPIPRNESRPASMQVRRKCLMSLVYDRTMSSVQREHGFA